MMRYVLVFLICALFLAFEKQGVASENRPFTLLASIVSSSDLSGGLRYSIDENWVVDGWASSREDSDGDHIGRYWADIYYQNWGLVLTGESNQFSSAAFAYAQEHYFTDKIGIGAAVKLVEFNESDTAFAGGWDVYILLKI
jgi:hypothetical protein